MLFQWQAKILQGLLQFKAQVWRGCGQGEQERVQDGPLVLHGQLAGVRSKVAGLTSKVAELKEVIMEGVTVFATFTKIIEVSLWWISNMAIVGYESDMEEEELYGEWLEGLKEGSWRMRNMDSGWNPLKGKFELENIWPSFPKCWHAIPIASCHMLPWSPALTLFYL